jgi:host factor-I protein
MARHPVLRYEESSRLLYPQSQQRRVVAREKKACRTGGAMKDAIDSIAVERAVEPEGFGNRKLIRPSLNRTDHNHMSPSMGERRERADRQDRPDRQDRQDRPDRGDRSGGGKKIAPPEQTNAENFYYQKQMQSRTPMVIVLRDGEEVHGVIEWYDKCCIKVNRTSQPNLLIYKPCIKYIYKEGENAKK